MRGLFVTLEGIEGSGKSTQLARLARRLRGQHLPVVTTREPGGTPTGEAIRRLLLNVRHTALDPKAELFLYLAGRAHHLRQIVRPALAKGCIVLCDRFSDATLAYQGYGRQLLSPPLRQSVGYASDGLQPDLTLLLDLDPHTALARVRRRRVRNRLDRERLAFHRRVRRGYLRLARQHPSRIKLVDACSSASEVARSIDRIVAPRLPSRHNRAVVRRRTRRA